MILADHSRPSDPTHAEFNLSNLWISAFGVWILHLSLCCRRSKPQNKQKTFRTS
ncbi:hypothetical protein PtB15_11B203 [Puccinia triticina]|nr:hypothetical protein PtB15_11B203 [Puccinia triticina]